MKSLCYPVLVYKESDTFLVYLRSSDEAAEAIFLVEMHILEVLLCSFS